MIRVLLTTPLFVRDVNVKYCEWGTVLGTEDQESI